MSARAFYRCLPQNSHYPGSDDTPKGKASGWIEERVGNKSWKKPSVSHIYKWEDATGKHSLYIKASKVVRVMAMVYEERRSVEEVLKFLGK